MYVIFLPMGKKQQAEYGEKLSAAAGRAAVSISADCAGHGTCGKCKVRIVSEMQALRMRLNVIFSERSSCLRGGVWPAESH